MTSWRIILVSVLGCLACLVAGFAASGLLQRNASAQGLEPSLEGSVSNAVNAVLPGKPYPVGPGNSFVTDVYNAVSPAVVHISYSYVVRNFFADSVQESSGSGVIVDPRGYILTNFHVIQGSDKPFVVLSTGKQYQATLIGSDPGTDLALLKIDAEEDLPTATLGDSTKTQVGEWVVAIGNPMGFDWTVTAGVVSAVGRDAPSPTGQTIRGLLQTDAAINPGNSGGPLLNAAGEVIGINEQIASRSGGSEGIGLAIPINTAKAVLSDLIKFGKVQRAWLGVRIYKEVNPVIQERNHLPVDFGVIIAGVYSPSPASKAGLLPFTADQRSGLIQFDILTSIDGKKIKNEQQLLDVIRESKANDSVQIEVYRVKNDEYSVQRLQCQLSPVPDKAQTTWGVI